MKRLGRWRIPGAPVRGVVLICLGLGTVLLGTVGYARQDANLSSGDSIYSGIKLLLTDGGNAERDEPMALEIARWCGLLFAGLAVIEGLWLLARSQWERARVLTARNHVIVAGLGDYSFQLARSFAAEGYRVVAVERDAANPAIRGCRERRIPVVVGDATDERLFGKAQVRHASYVIATCGDDAANVHVALTAADEARGRPRALTCFVHLDNLSLWPQLKAGALASGERLGARMEFFNVYETGARILLDRHPAFDRAASSAHVLLVGLDGIAESLIVAIAGGWRNREEGATGPLRLTVVAPEARARMEALAERHPQLGEVVDVDARDHEIDAGALQRGELLRDARFAAVYVSLGREGDGVAAALALGLRLPAGAPPVVLAVRDEASGLTRAVRAGAATQIEPFGVLTHALPPRLLLRGANEMIARAKHEHYLRCEAAKGIVRDDNPSVVAWDLLPESLKESNRAFADRIGPKLEAAGCSLVPNPLIGPDANGFAFTDDEIERLGRIEHQGWRDALERERMASWRGEGSGPPVAPDADPVGGAGRGRARQGPRPDPRLAGDARGGRVRAAPARPVSRRGHRHRRCQVVRR